MKYIKIHSNPNQMKTTSEIKKSYPKKKLLDDETIVAFVKKRLNTWNLDLDLMTSTKNKENRNKR